jgi:glycosyltransferase involved in cell wall biosynthesis
MTNTLICNSTGGVSPPSHPKLRVLLVPDLLQWITGTIAQQIACHNETWLEATIISGTALKELIDYCGSYPGEIDLIHFLTGGEAHVLLPYFEGKVPCVVTVHHVVEVEDYATLTPRGDAVMTSSKQWYDYLIDHQVPADNLVMVPYGVDAERFRPSGPGERDRLLADLGLPPDAFVVGFCAKRTSDVRGRKGTDTLVRAVGELRRRLPRVALLIVGPGWSDLVAEMRSEGTDCVYIPFLSDPNEFAAIYRCLNSYWITARIEGGPVPLLEAMASGVCCVTTPVGMVLDLVRNGENALIAPIDDAEAFVSHTERLVKDADLARRMGESARETILDQYQWRQTSRNVFPLYRTAFERFRARTGVAGDLVLAEPEWGVPGPTAPEEPRLASLPQWARGWVTTRDHYLFTNSLRMVGDSQTANHLDRERFRWSDLADPGKRRAGFDGAVELYWWAFCRGNRFSALAAALGAFCWQPWRVSGWKMIALALLKKMQKKSSQPDSIQ